jgi:hypothetical protein
MVIPRPEQDLGTPSSRRADGHVKGNQTAAASNQRRIAIATGGDAIPELVTELRNRSERIRLRETDLAAAKRTPAKVRQLLARAEREATALLAEVRELLATTQRSSCAKPSWRCSRKTR